jgi:uncharacterized protein (TIGR00730 family)
MQLGSLLAESGIGLVYGGAHVGLMGTLADAVLASGGLVEGVIPQGLVDHEIAHTGLTRLHVVRSMHERKMLMAELSDGFIAIPGGFGTLEEFCEVLTWNQLGIHAKPCGLLNTLGYFDGLISMFAHGVAEGFVRGTHADSVLVSEEPSELLLMLQEYTPVAVPKWI